MDEAQELLKKQRRKNGINNQKFKITKASDSRAQTLKINPPKDQMQKRWR